MDIDWNVTILILGICLSLRKTYTFTKNNFCDQQDHSCKSENMFMDKYSKYGNYIGWVSLPASP